MSIKVDGPDRDELLRDNELLRVAVSNHGRQLRDAYLRGVREVLAMGERSPEQDVINIRVTGLEMAKRGWS